MPGLRTIAILDPVDQSVWSLQRGASGEWTDHGAIVGAGLRVESLGLVMPHSEIFHGL